MVVEMHVPTLVFLDGNPAAAHGRGARQVKVPPRGNSVFSFPNTQHANILTTFFALASILRIVLGLGSRRANRARRVAWEVRLVGCVRGLTAGEHMHTNDGYEL